LAARRRSPGGAGGGWSSWHYDCHSSALENRATDMDRTANTNTLTSASFVACRRQQRGGHGPRLGQVREEALVGQLGDGITRGAHRRRVGLRQAARGARHVRRRRRRRAARRRRRRKQHHHNAHVVYQHLRAGDRVGHGRNPIHQRLRAGNRVRYGQETRPPAAGRRPAPSHSAASCSAAWRQST